MAQRLRMKKRYPILVDRTGPIHVTLVGCGGTGSFLAHDLARLAYHAHDRYNLQLQIAFVDPDTVELKNVGRQNFVPAEVGLPKAWALMQRYNLAYGLKIGVAVERFDRQHVSSGYNSLHILVGCVDNHAARAEIHEVARLRNGRLWWLDCGNHYASGQVILGNQADIDRPDISQLGFCRGLPLPTVRHPELLAPGEPPREEEPLSCAELALRDAQSLMINRAVASYASQYLYRLIVTRDLDIWATYVNLDANSAQSEGICRERRRRKKAPRLARMDAQQLAA